MVEIKMHCPEPSWRNTFCPATGIESSDRFPADEPE